jgi:protocatechuate 3,4-dioxygenase beta subunit
MNKRVYALIALVAVIVGAAFFLLRGGGEEAEVAEENADDGSGRAALIEKKMAAREAGAVDMTPATIGGKVTRASDGKPIPGAVVLLNRKSLDQGASDTPGQPNEPMSVVTDDAGEWRMPSIAPGRYTLSASAEGFLPGANDDVRLAAASERKDLDLTLEAGGHTLSGIVSDIGGGPVEQVLLTVTDMESTGLMSFRRASFATLSKEDGSYQMQLPNGSWVVTTYHPDYVSNFKMTTIQDGPRVENIKITPAGAIEGVVLSRQDDKPIANARIVFNDGRNGQQNQDFRTNISGGGFPLVTDDQGHFRVTGLHPGVVKLTAFADGYASNEPVDVALGIGEEVSGVEVYVDRAYKIAGFVVPKGSTEEGLEGVLVGAFSIQPPTLVVATAPSASDGYFEIQGVRPGNYMVGAIGEETLPNIMGNSAIVTDKDVTNMLIEMDTGVHVTGRVDPGGVAKVKIKQDMEQFSMSKMVETMTNAMANATADADGNFDLGPINPGTFTLVATNSNGDKGELEITVGDGGVENVVLQMEPRASISGVVLDEGGVPQSGMRVEIKPVAKAGAANVNMDFGNPFGTGTPTGEDGSFTVRGLEPGPHTVLVKSAKGRALAWAAPEDSDAPMAPMEIEVEDREQRTGFDLTVEARSGEITGLVIDADGIPVADAWVTASEEMSASEFGESFRGQKPKDDEGVRVAVTVGGDDDDEEDEFDVPAFFAEPPVLTDANGRFLIKELRADRSYRLVAEGAKGGARARKSEVSPGADVTLELESLAGIEGKVSRSGKAVSTYTVEIDGPTKRKKSVFAEDGTFLIDRIDPGEYEVRVTADAGVAEAETEVESGSHADVKIELEDWGKLKGEVVAVGSGEPIPGLFVMVVPEKGGPDASQALAMFTGGGTKTDRKGKFEAGKVGPGKGQIIFLDREAAMSAGGAVAVEKYEIEAGEEKDLGTIRGVPASDIPADERGDLGFSTTVATMAKRPRPPGSDEEAAKKEAEEQGAEEGEDAERHLWVLSVKDEGPAAEAGLEPADQILTIDGQDVSAMGMAAARSLLSKAHVRVGQTIKLQVERDGSKQSISIEAVALAEDDAPAKPGG